MTSDPFDDDDRCLRCGRVGATLCPECDRRDTANLRRSMIRILCAVCMGMGFLLGVILSSLDVPSAFYGPALAFALGGMWLATRHPKGDR